MFKLLHPMLRIDRREIEFARRGFACRHSELRDQFEYVGAIFLKGYHLALEQDDPHRCADELDQIENEHRGFAYEGAAMAFALLDGITPRRKWNLFQQFVEGPAHKHIYMAYIGAGWACARLPWLRWRIESVITVFHPVLCSLVIDGYGFHEGFFHWRTPLRRKVERLSENARHAFYQGLGRSLWFIHGADGGDIQRTILTFAPQFRGDAWSGVGLACAYAGGPRRNEMEELLCAAGPYCPALAQGAAFAAKARRFAGNPAVHTELACNVLCGMSAASAAALCDETLLDLSHMHPSPYQHWRELLQKRLSQQAVLVNRALQIS